MAARLIRKAEERKEEKRAGDQQPAKHLETVLLVNVILPVGSWDLEDSRIVAIVVRVRPAIFHTVVRPERKDIRSHGNGTEYFDARKTDQAEVPATVEVPVG